jgi:hypothetical protein
VDCGESVHSPRARRRPKPVEGWRAVEGRLASVAFRRETPSSQRTPHMDFSESPSVKSIRGILREFMEAEVFPAEQRLRDEGFVALLPGEAAAGQGDRAVGGLRAREVRRRRAPPNRVRPRERELGKSPIGNYVFNCQAPELRNHRHEIFDDAFREEFESMCRDTGAGKDPKPPALMAMALLLHSRTRTRWSRGCSTSAGNGCSAPRRWDQRVRALRRAPWSGAAPPGAPGPRPRPRPAPPGRPS